MSVKITCVIEIDNTSCFARNAQVFIAPVEAPLRDARPTSEMRDNLWHARLAMRPLETLVRMGRLGLIDFHGQGMIQRNELAEIKSKFREGTHCLIDRAVPTLATCKPWRKMHLDAHGIGKANMNIGNATTVWVATCTQIKATMVRKSVARSAVSQMYNRFGKEFPLEILGKLRSI